MQSLRDEVKALREDLGVAEGLASEQVYILDPCCGTGAFLAAVLKRIDATLAESGLGALKGQMLDPPVKILGAKRLQSAK